MQFVNEKTLRNGASQCSNFSNFLKIFTAVPRSSGRTSRLTAYLWTISRLSALCEDYASLCNYEEIFLSFFGVVTQSR